MKWLSWLGRLSVTIVMVCLLTIVTTGYVVNYYVENILSRFHISMTDGGPSVTDIMKGLVGFQNSSQGTTPKVEADSDLSAQLPPQNSESQSIDPQVESQNNESQNNQSQDAESQNNASPNKETDNSEVVPPATGGSSAGTNQSSGQKGAVVVTPDDLIAKKDSLDNKDKEDVFAILMSKLPQEEMQKITEYMENGLTETEVLATQQVLSKYLDKTEYAKVMEILKK